MTSEELMEQLKQKTDEVEQILKEYLPAEEGLQKTVLEAANYSVNAGGKRLRPMLMNETYRLLGGRGKEIEPFMAAIEMIHTSSLIHDDLPCMDNDELRRGQPTTWKKYGYDMAVLAGDALLIYAVETGAKALAYTKYPDRVCKCLSILAAKTGIYGMIGGQTVDVEMTGRELSREQLDFIYRLKTGALLEAAMLIGATMAGASSIELTIVEQAASYIGLAFQIQDDILDVEGDEKKLGKPVKSDEKNSKTTYVTLEGLNKAKEDVEEISARALDCIGSLRGKNEFLEELIRALVTRKK